MSTRMTKSEFELIACLLRSKEPVMDAAVEGLNEQAREQVEFNR